MEWFTKFFLKASLFWLALGVSLGAAMAMHRPLTVYRTAHLHMTLLGFVAMMIFGVGYHVLPRIAGHPLHSRTMAGLHWWIANAGLVVLAAGFALSARGLEPAGALLAVGGGASASGAYLFACNIWRTLDGPGAMRRGTGRPLPIGR